MSVNSDQNHRPSLMCIWFNLTNLDKMFLIYIQNDRYVYDTFTLMTKRIQYKDI